MDVMVYKWLFIYLLHGVYLGTIKIFELIGNSDYIVIGPILLFLGCHEGYLDLIFLTKVVCLHATIIIIIISMWILKMFPNRRNIS